MVEMSTRMRIRKKNRRNKKNDIVMHRKIFRGIF